jgi:hypothetical protein
MTKITLPNKPQHPELTKAISATDTREIGILTIYVPREDIKALQRIALDKDCSVSELMRQLITEYLDTP